MKFPTVGNLEALGLLFSLLPGFITFVTVRWLTAPHRKIEAVEAILHGLAFTLLVHAIWIPLHQVFPLINIVGLSLSALGLGAALSWLINTDTVYGFLR